VGCNLHTDIGDRSHIARRVSLSLRLAEVRYPRRMTFLRSGTKTTFEDVESMGSWLDSLDFVRLTRMPYERGEIEWRVEIEAEPIDPAFVTHPPQKLVLSGTGEVDFEAHPPAVRDSITVEESEDGLLRLKLVKEIGLAMTLESSSITVEAKPTAPEHEEWIVPVRGLGRHRMEDAHALHWFETVHGLSVRGINDGVVAIEVRQREEDDTTMLGTVRAETCEADLDPDEPLRDGGIVDQADTGAGDDGTLRLRLIVHGGKIKLSGRAIELELDSIAGGGSDEDDDD
jgi:hypothetical protein